MLNTFLKLQFRVKVTQRIRLVALFLLFLYFLYIATTLNSFIYFFLSLSGFMMILDFNSIRYNVFFELESINLLPYNNISKFLFLLTQELFGFKFFYFIATLIILITFVSTNLIEIMSIILYFIVYNSTMISVFFMVRRFSIASILIKNILPLISTSFIIGMLFIYLDKSKMGVASDYLNGVNDLHILNITTTIIAVTLLLFVNYLSKIKPFTSRNIISHYNKKYWY